MIKLPTATQAIAAAALAGGLLALGAPARADNSGPAAPITIATPVPTAAPAPAMPASPAPADAAPTRRAPTAPPYPCNNINAYVTRPTVATSACAVQPGQVVLETGYTNTTTTGVGANSTINVPQAFVHAGISPRIEVNFTPPSAQSTNNGMMKTSGDGDVGFGTKAVLGYSSRAVYGVGGSMTLPTGSSAYTNGANTYELLLNGSYTLTNTLSLFGTAGFTSLVGTDANGNLARFGSFIPAVGATYSLPSNWSVFVEGANFSKIAPNAGSRTLVDYGIIKVAGRMQFDAEVGNTPNAGSGSRFHYVGFGVSALFGR